MLNRIQYKIGFISAICLLVVVAAGIVISLFNNDHIEQKIEKLIHSELKNQSAAQLQAIASLESEKVARNLERSLSVALGIKSTIETFIENGDKEALDRERISEYLRGLLTQNKSISGTYVAWSKNAVDGLDEQYANTDSKHSFKDGRYAPYWNRGADGAIAVRPLNLQDVAVDEASGSTNSDWFLCPLKNKRVCITEPYSWDVQGKLTLGTSITLPLMVNGKVYGMAGIDIGLGEIQKFVSATAQNLYEGRSKLYVFSRGGLVAGDSANPSQIGKKVSAEMAELLGQWNTSNKAAFNESADDFFAYAPVKVDLLDQIWGAVIQLPKEHALEGVNEMEELMESNFEESINEQILMSLLVAIGGVIILLLFARSIAKPIEQSALVITDIASKDGDLTNRLDMHRSDEIGQLADGVDAFIGKTQEIVKDIAGEMNNVEGSALRTSEIAELSNSRVDQQRSEIEMVAAAVTQMSANAGEVARNAEDAANSAGQVKLAVDLGANNVRESAESIKTLSAEMEGVGTVMQQLADDSENISKIVEVINGISEQTNLLALNAAIEAARAGEQGRGFSVVADEVRNLASKTQQSTLEIQQLIDKLQGRSHQAVDALQQGSEHVSECLERAEVAVDTLGGVVSEINGIDNMTSQIATASEQQAEVSEDISRNISNISSAVNEISQASNDSLSESARLFDLVKKLEQQLSRFKY